MNFDKSSKTATATAVYAGLLWDLSGKAHRLADAFQERWLPWFDHIQATPPMTARAWVSVASVMFYAVRVLELPPARYRPAYRWVAHIAGAVQAGTQGWSQSVRPWKDAAKVLRGFLPTLRENSWVTYMPLRKCPYDVWSDSSLRGWAHLLTKAGTLKVLAGKYGSWKYDEAIDMLELRASVWLVTAVIKAAPPGTHW